MTPIYEDVDLRAVTTTASEVCQRIYDLAYGSINVSDGNPHWFDQATSMITLLAGASEVLYLDHNVGKNGEAGSKIIAFTSDVLIVVGVDDEVFSSQPVARVISRGALTKLHVNEVANAVGFKGSTWPNSLSVSLDYGGEIFNLPFRAPDATAARELGALLPSLARDVSDSNPASA
jgi:hypothetical protein